MYCDANSVTEPGFQVFSIRVSSSIFKRQHNEGKNLRFKLKVVIHVVTSDVPVAMRRFPNGTKTALKTTDESTAMMMMIKGAHPVVFTALSLPLPSAGRRPRSPRRCRDEVGRNTAAARQSLHIVNLPFFVNLITNPKSDLN